MCGQNLTFVCEWFKFMIYKDSSPRFTALRYFKDSSPPRYTARQDILSTTRGSGPKGASYTEYGVRSKEQYPKSKFPMFCPNCCRKEGTTCDPIIHCDVALQVEKGPYQHKRKGLAKSTSPSDASLHVKIYKGRL